MSDETDGLVFGYKWDGGGDDPIADLEAFAQRIREPAPRPHVRVWSEVQIRRFLLYVIEVAGMSVEQANAQLESCGLPTPLYGPHQDMFRCDECGGTFVRGWSDEEAHAESVELWGVRGDGPGMAQVCEPCFERLVPSSERDPKGDDRG